MGGSVEVLGEGVGRFQIDRRYAFPALREALDHLARGAFDKVVVEMTAAGDRP